MLVQTPVDSPSAVPFWIAFVATLVCVVGALVSGYRCRRRLHLVFGPAAMVALAFAIVFTEQLVRRYEFPRENLDFHLVFAKSAAALALPVIITGIVLLFRPKVRKLHLVCVWVWLAATLVATGTGFWMFSTGTLR
ncbi:MAG: hypothetical protein NXI31_02220 [bacterium]|nr:hypothetical protein [bacterium]